MIPNFKTYISESVWGNISKRAEGSLDRKEDDVNLMDIGGFADYLRKIYVVKNNSSPINSGNKYIILPILSYRHTYRSLMLYPEKKRAQVRRTNYEKWPEGIRDYLDDNYDVELSLDEKKDWMYFIFPKNGKEPNNRFFISLIDDILAHVDEPLLERKVNESVWGNISKRAEGGIERKEDDIDLLDFDQFYEYLNNRYQPCYVNQNIDHVTGSLNYIDVPLLCGRTMSHLAIYKDPRIKPYIFMKDVDLYPELIDTFSLNYDITIDDVEKGWKSIYIYTKGKRNQDEKHTNSFYVQLIDYILDMDKPEQIKNMLERKVNESVWGNISKRAEGGIERKEDDINLLDGKGFESYLKKIYKNVNTPFYIFIDKNNTITVPVFKGQRKQTWCVLYDYSNNLVHMRFDFLYYEDPDLFEKMRFEYKTYMIDKSFSKYVKFEPRKGDVSNKFFIDVIDFLLENGSQNLQKILVKDDQMNESVWGNISKRAEGGIERKEDDVNSMDRDAFFDYLIEHYEYIGNADSKIYGFQKSQKRQSIDVPIYQYWSSPYSIYLEFDANSHSYLSIHPFRGRYIFIPYIKVDKYVPPTLQKLYDNFNVEEVYGTRGFEKIINYLSITPKDGGQPTNKFFLEVIDFIINNIEEPLIPTLKKL